MAEPRIQASRAGGAIIAFSVLIGAIIGIACRQPSLGTVIGATTGVVIATALFLWDRRR